MEKSTNDPQKKLRTEYVIQRLSLFGWDDYTYRLQLYQCWNKLRDLQLAHPQRGWRLVRRQIKEDIYEMDPGTI